MESSVSWRSTSTSLPSTSFFSLRTLAAFSVQAGYSRNCFAKYALQYFPISAMGNPPHFLIDSNSVIHLKRRARAHVVSAKATRGGSREGITVQVRQNRQA